MTAVGDDLCGEASAAIELATAEPGRARQVAEDVLARARRARVPTAVSMAEQALGLAAREVGEIAGAVRHLRNAVRVAERAGLVTRAAEARVSLAPTLQYAGQAAPALREADRAAAVLRGPALARLQMQRSGILVRLGRTEEALDLLAPAAATFRRTGDVVWEARLLNLRGILHGNRGAYAAGERDFRRAGELFAAAGDEVAAAHMVCNRAWLSGRRGEVPAALALYDESEARLRALGVPFTVPLVDKCEVLLAVHLGAEARSTAEAAVREFAAGGMASDVPEAQLKVAHAALLEGDSAAAAAAAGRAAAAFARQGRPGWEAMARWAAVRARCETARPTAATQRAAVAAAESLDAAGQVVVALDARLVAARIALQRRKVAEAESLLAPVRVRRGTPAELRTRTWYAQALLRTAQGDRSGAERALRAGWQVLDEYRASLGATELRASVSGHGQDLARLGVAHALEAGRPDGVLRWVERARAAALRLRPVRPPDDDALAHDLAELREVAAELAKAHPPGAAAKLMSRQVALEEAVRRRARQAAGSGAVDAVPTLPRLASALAERVLLEIVQVDGFLHALVVRDGRAVLHAMGPAAAAERELEQLRSALRRLAHRRGSAASLQAAVAAAAAAGEGLEALLIAPVAADIADRSLVISPPGRLYALPWSVLPSCRGRPLSVVPSSALWLRTHEAAASLSGDGRAPLLVAGPGLAHAAEEVELLRGTYAAPTVLVGEAATAGAVGGNLHGAGLAHIAAHGSFRADNPLFSCLRLADGPFTVYDLEALGAAPPVLVLSACESGLSAVRPGDELMGLASALFMIGTRALVASVGPVPDDATKALMVRFHQRLASGSSPSQALASAGGGDRPTTDPAWVAAASFLCFGAG
ncbi:MAG TPA: CHAT domain-containing protein [Acidimicrobiales bacterium]|nr:CHAT domain-containing protein [Acidimicrobiales bacterium]